MISCPAVEFFSVVQISANLLQVMWALQTPYERVAIKITVEGVTTTYFYTGNTGSMILPFSNPGTPVTITGTAQTICNEAVTPIEVGPVTTVTLGIETNALPVALNDTFKINKGHSSAVPLPTSVLANDYSPDGSVIEAVVASGATTAGGTYSIDASGFVQYTPPSPTFAGSDSFIYEVKNQGETAASPAQVTINVGDTLKNVYVRMVYVEDAETRNQTHVFITGRN